MRIRPFLALALTPILLRGACGDDDDDGEGADGTAEEAASTTEPDRLEILLTNDDGVGGEGIDLLAQELQSLPNAEVTVVAPAENQSGSGDNSTEGDVQFDDSQLISGIPATAVEGTPADSVNIALQELALEPDLVVSGVNEGQNIGTLIDLSGTVGAAATAARQGVPAVAVSQGLADPLDYATGVDAAIAWITDHLDEYQSGEADPLVNLNIPTCTAGEVREAVEVPPAEQPTGTELDPVDCTVTAEAPADDVEAFTSGFVAISLLEPETLEPLVP